MAQQMFTLTAAILVVSVVILSLIVLVCCAFNCGVKHGKAAMLKRIKTFGLFRGSSSGGTTPLLPRENLENFVAASAPFTTEVYDSSGSRIV